MRWRRFGPEQLLMMDSIGRAYSLPPSALLDMSPFDLALNIRCWLSGRAHSGAMIERAQRGGGLGGALNAVVAALMSRP